MLSPPRAQALRRQVAWLPGWWPRQQTCLSRPRWGLHHSCGGHSFPAPFLKRGAPKMSLWGHLQASRCCFSIQ